MSNQADRDVKATVLRLVRDLLKVSPSSAPDAIAILQSCAEAYRARGLLLETILQDPTVKGPAPLYWVILKNKSSATDARQACLLNSDGRLLQRLRKSPGCAGVNAKDELLLAEAPQDWVLVQNARRIQGRASLLCSHSYLLMDTQVMFHIVRFQQRTRVSQFVRAESIVRGRIWLINFISLDTRSAVRTEKARGWRRSDWRSTHLASRLVIQPTPALASSKNDPVPQVSGTTMAGWANRIAGSTSSKDGARLPTAACLRSPSTQVGEHDCSNTTRQKCAVAVLADSAGGAALEYEMATSQSGSPRSFLLTLKAAPS